MRQNKKKTITFVIDNANRNVLVPIRALRMAHQL